MLCQTNSRVFESVVVGCCEGGGCVGQHSPSVTLETTDHPLLKISSTVLQWGAVGTQLGSGGRLMIISARREAAEAN